MTIAESFKRFRGAFNLSKTDVANTLGIKLPSYGYESEGKGIFPNARTLIKLADTYNVSVDYLLGRTNNPRPWEFQTESEPVAESENKTSDVATLQAKVDKIESALAAHGIKI